MNLSLLSFNTFATPFFAHNITKRYQKMAEIINTEDIDIVCFQEVQTYYHLMLLKKYLTNFPYLSYKKYVYGPKGGVVTASKQPMKKVNYQSFTELGSFKNISFYTRLLQNGMLMCEMTTHPFVIVNTHLVSDFEFDWSPTNKLYDNVQAQVEQVATEINRLSSAGYSVIVTGDFNMKKNATLYKHFIEQTKATDAFAKDESPTYHKERLPYRFQGKTSERIDFIFTKNGQGEIKIKKKSQLFDTKVALSPDNKSYLSDHVALKIDFDIV